MAFSWKDAISVALPTFAGTVGAVLDQKEGNKNRQQQDEANQLNYDMQKEFAQMGIRWRVDDAKAAGLHPLAALGASGSGASPSFQINGPDYSRGNIAREMGQNISRAVQSTMTADERTYQNTLNSLALDRAGLENDLLRHQIRKISGADNPPMPSVIETPLTRVAAEKDRHWQEIGSYPSVAYMQSPTGLVPVMPPNLAEALESDQTNQIQWALRYKGGPNIAPLERPSNNKLPRGAAGWVWSHKLQEWQPRTTRELETSGRKMAERKWFRRTHNKYKDHQWGY